MSLIRLKIMNGIFKYLFYKCEACSAKTGEGLVAGLEWLSERLVMKKNTKFPNNPYKINSIIFDLKCSI